MSAVLTDPRVHAVSGPLSLARLAALDPLALDAAGHHRLVLADPVPLGEDDEFDVRFVRLLREAISVALHVDWTAAGAVPFDPDDVCHLQPPARGPDHAWRDRFRFGLCFYRKGPGFVLLKDTRDLATGARFRLDDPRAVAAFDELEQVLSVSGSPPLSAPDAAASGTAPAPGMRKAPDRKRSGAFSISA